MSGQKCVSIDIGGKNIYIVEGIYKTSFVEISNAFSLDTPVGSIVDGKLEDKGILRDIIKQVLQQKKIKAGNIIFTVQSTTAITRDIVLPAIKKEDMRNAVIYEMEQYLPSSANLYNIEYKIIGEIFEGNIKKYKIRSAAMPKELVDAYHSLASELKLTPYALDIHSNAISKLFKDQFSINGVSYTPEQTFAFIDMGHRNTAVHIISNRKLEFSRIVSFGGRELDTAVASGFDIDLNSAEQKKKEIGLVENENVLKPVIGQQMLEIQKMFQYYTSRGGGAKIQTVFLYGGGAGLKGLIDYIKNEMNMKAIVIEDLSVVKARNADKSIIRGCLNAAGALVRL